MASMKKGTPTTFSEMRYPVLLEGLRIVRPRKPVDPESLKRSMTSRAATRAARKSSKI